MLLLSQSPHAPTHEEIDATQQEAQREVADARTEAAKDLKSATKVSGSDPAVVAEAKVSRLAKRQ